MKQILEKIRRDETGMTLVELLAAIAILSIIVTAFLAFFIQAANTNKMTHEVNEATFIAQGVMEELTHYSSEGLTDVNAEDSLNRDYPGFTVESNITKADDSSLYKVIVTVKEKGKIRAVMETRLPFAEGNGD